MHNKKCEKKTVMTARLFDSSAFGLSIKMWQLQLRENKNCFSADS